MTSCNAKILLFLWFIVILRLHAYNQTADFLKGLISGLSLQYALIRRNCLLGGRRKGRRDAKEGKKGGK